VVVVVVVFDVVVVVVVVVVGGVVDGVGVFFCTDAILNFLFLFTLF